MRGLRIDRRWTQTELARIIGLSQNRLSEIERGHGSFTAEQLLMILQIFNVPVSHFVPALSNDQTSELQNAMARLGAAHLRESDGILPKERLADPSNVIRETLATGTPRLITALGPVLVSNIDGVNLKKLQLQLGEAGLERRLGWLVENVLHAVKSLRTASLPRRLRRSYRRAEVMLDSFNEHVSAQLAQREQTPDILDEEIRSKRTLNQVQASSSDISHRWGIVTGLQPEDFTKALGEAHAH